MPTSVIPDHTQWPDVMVTAPTGRLLPRVPAPGDGLIHQVVLNAFAALKNHDNAYAVNLFEAVLRLETRNRWIYHSIAWQYLARLHAREGRPDLEKLEQSLRLAPFMPDALELCMEYDRALAQRVIDEATGLKALELDGYLALMQAGNWTEILAFRHDDDTFRDKTVLDFGARTGFHGLAFLAFGARLYAAVDQVSKSYKQTSVKSYFHDDHRRMELGFNMREIGERYPERFRLMIADGTHKDPNRYDFIALFAVTEHLGKTTKIMRLLDQWLADEGRILIAHHNYYCWNGHHAKPNNTVTLRKMLEAGEEAPLADWQFFDEKPPEGAWLNKQTMAQFTEVCRRYYGVVEREVTYTKYGKGGERLSAEVLERIGRDYPDLTPEDIMTQSLRLELRKRPDVRIDSPAMGDVWHAGRRQSVVWNPEAIADEAVTITLRGGPRSPHVIAEAAPNNGCFIWQVPRDQRPGWHYRIELCAQGGKVFGRGKSGGRFAIGRAPVLASIAGFLRRMFRSRRK